MGEALLVPPHPFLQQILGQIFKDDISVFSPHRMEGEGSLEKKDEESGK
jgi:hypothetical protein